MGNPDESESGPVSEKHKSLKPLAQAGDAAFPEEKRWSIDGFCPTVPVDLGVFDVLAERLLASQQRSKKIQQQLADGWAPEEVLKPLCDRLSWRTTSPKPPGHPEGSAVDGQRLKAYRNALKLTQEEFAAECSKFSPIKVRTIQRGEAGDKWSHDTFQTVAETLARLSGEPVSTADLQTRQ